MPTVFDCDDMASDDPAMEEIVLLSAKEHEASTSTAYANYQAEILDRKQKVAQINRDIKALQQKQKILVKEWEEFERLAELATRPQDSVKETIYSGEFPWSRELKLRMKEVFGIDSFRLCQEGVCNANLDGRDIVCIMPTGGGKSLTYQLPALLSTGCTLVISPLLSLISDQVKHLHDAGVEAVMLTGSKSSEEQKHILDRLKSSAAGQVNGKGKVEKEIKLCYITPEKMVKDKQVQHTFGILDRAKRFPRIVVDEAHCASELGHDYRPLYKELALLKRLYSHVPILALSATCPPHVLQNLIKILRLNPITDSKRPNPSGTVYFSSPLYRKNLHYNILAKPKDMDHQVQAMVDYILDKHTNQSGIIYCLSKQDTEEVAAEVGNRSGGKIKTGVYHADVSDAKKERLHDNWRNGTVQVVCATIAFGLGIDKANVRFVLHHSLPVRSPPLATYQPTAMFDLHLYQKSLENYYQESGRAGRDGKDAECVLYYRPQDAFRLPDIYTNELDGHAKIFGMLRHFSDSSHLALSSWTTDGTDLLKPCGHCDNCTRLPDTFDEKDVTLDAWRILKVMQQLEHKGDKATMLQLSQLVRGNRGKGNNGADITAVPGGKVLLSNEETEILIIHLLISGYIQELCVPTAYKTTIYLKQTSLAGRYLELDRNKVEMTQERIICRFLKRGSTRRRVTGSRAQKTSSSKEPAVMRSVSRNRKRPAADESSFVVVPSDDEAPLPGPSSTFRHMKKIRKDFDNDSLGKEVIPRSNKDKEKSTYSARAGRRPLDFDDSDSFINDEDEDEDDIANEWTYDLRTVPRYPRTKSRVSVPTSGRAQETGDDDQMEVIELSSD
ncbi:hypothetical protein EW146_g1014 [Bondarzewia mesenterica]|uniref:DNA 3'-5' helicase n=1 Tax=Bondarzewia mesenterica TaxID=1095465 RepID=A0A4V3XG75_9AGAM|nr:hypothetical protein EW146_g1014 [Bondarzewia mesenterica]